MKTILLTGASGFTGRWMQAALIDQGYHVVALKSDLTQKASIHEELRSLSIDGVIHLAALSFVADTSLDAFYRVNVIGTLHLLEVLHELSVTPPRVLIASSANIYGIPSVELIDEEQPPAPINHYACSKLAMEYLVRPWFDRMPIVITRPFNYTGFGQDERFLIPKIVGHFVRRASSIALGNLDISRDFSDVRDVVSIYLALLESDIQGVTVNVCSQRTISLKTIIALMNQMAGYDIDVQVNPALMRTNEIPILKGNHTYLRSLIDRVPQMPFETTLKDMYTMFLTGEPCLPSI